MKICNRWGPCQKVIENHLDIKRLVATNVEDGTILFLTVYKTPHYDYVKQFLKISKKKSEMTDIL